MPWHYQLQRPGSTCPCCKTGSSLPPAVPLDGRASPRSVAGVASRRRSRLESCRLSSLEQNILDIRRTEEDVPGYLIPDIYTQYHLTGVVTELLVRVFYIT